MRCKPAFAAALALFLAGCNTANVKPAAPAPAASAATSTTQSKPDSKPDSSGATRATAPTSQTPPEAPSNSAADTGNGLSSRLDRLSGRLALMQAEVSKLKSQGEQQTQLAQAILARLQVMTQARSAAATDTASAAENSDSQSGQLDAAIGQLMQTINDMNASTGTGGRYGVTTTYTGKGAWILLRYRTDTGETWIADKGHWKPLKDQDSLPSSRYVVQVRRADGDLKGYVAVRIDQNSGKSWWLKADSWQVYE